jgi:hypothetical protein
MGVLDFFATGQGVLALGLLAALIVLLWDWRVALIALVLIQIGVATLLVQVENASGQIMFVQTLIVALCAVMIAIAGLQVQLRRSGRQSGGWFFRLLVLALLGIALYSLDLSVVLPEVSPAITRIFGWIALIALIMLSLGDNPVFTITALIIWCVLGQAMAALYAPASEVMVAIGLMELVLGLTASYLLLAERLPRVVAAPAIGNGIGPARQLPSQGGTEHGAPAFLRRPAVIPGNAPSATGAQPQGSLPASRTRPTEYDLLPVAPPKGNGQSQSQASAESRNDTTQSSGEGSA